MTEESPAEQNRRKLEEHLARLKEQGGKLPPRKDTLENAKAQADPLRDPPKPPPKPAGWDAWKKVHGARIHTVREVDAGALTEAADLKLLELKAGAGKDEIRRNFNRLAKEFHPDHGGDAEIYMAMQAAYKRLTKGK
jgi:DnaJ domain